MRERMGSTRDKGKPRSRSALVSRAFYSPEAIAAYTILCFPIGFFLYGLNVVRRGGRLIGSLLVGFSVALYVLFLIAAICGTGLRGSGVIGMIIASGLINLESTPYERALAEGGNKARSWPPLV